MQWSSNAHSVVVSRALTVLPSGLKRRLEISTSPAKESKPDAASTTSIVIKESIVTHEGTVWTWNFGNTSIDEGAAAKACGCKPHDYCWVMAAVLRLPVNPAKVCPFFGGKGPGGVDHTDVTSPVQVAKTQG